MPVQRHQHGRSLTSAPHSRPSGARRPFSVCWIAPGSIVRSRCHERPTAQRDTRSHQAPEGIVLVTDRQAAERRPRSTPRWRSSAESGRTSYDRRSRRNAQLPGVSRGRPMRRQASPRAGFRAILRQDPDVIMVGDFAIPKTLEPPSRRRSRVTWCFRRCTPTAPLPH
jgi:hypothetical protein